MSGTNVSAPTKATTINPVRGEALKTHPFQDASGIDVPLTRAPCDFKQLRETRAEDRAAVVSRFATVLRRGVDEFATIITPETGKPILHDGGYLFMARFVVINLIGLALLGAAWAEGLLTKPFEADHSGMCYLIVVLFIAGLVAVARKDWQTVRWAGNALVYLGMVGTVLGLIITVSDLSVDNAQSFESFKAIVTAIYVGSATALYTNLLACIGYLWLGTNAHLLARQEV